MVLAAIPSASVRTPTAAKTGFFEAMGFPFVRAALFAPGRAERRAVDRDLREAGAVWGDSSGFIPAETFSRISRSRVAREPYPKGFLVRAFVITPGVPGVQVCKRNYDCGSALICGLYVRLYPFNIREKGIGKWKSRGVIF